MKYISGEEYLRLLSESFFKLRYESIGFKADKDSKLLIPYLIGGYQVSEDDVRAVIAGQFTFSETYGCDIENRVVAVWTGRFGEGIHFSSDTEEETFKQQYEKRRRTINTIKETKGIAVSEDPYWGVLVFSCNTPYLFHCQFSDSSINNDTESICFAIREEYHALSSPRRYIIPRDFKEDDDANRQEFDWALFYSLWWNGEDNLFIRYALSELSTRSENTIKKRLTEMLDSYITSAVQEYEHQREAIRCLNPSIEYGCITEDIARYDWASHTKMLFEANRSLFIAARKSKQAVPDEEKCFNIIQEFCKYVRLEGKSKARFNGYGWDEPKLRQLFYYLRSNGHIAQSVHLDTFLYFFGAVARPYIQEPDCMIEWIGSEGGMIMAFIEEFTRAEEKSESHASKNRQIDWVKVNEAIHSDKFHLDAHKKPNVKRNLDGRTRTPYERSCDIIQAIKEGKSHKEI